MTSRIAAVFVLALAGLFVAAGVTYAASRLVSQPIGLSYHQRSLDDSLAPTKTITVTRTVTTVGSTGTTTTTSSAPARSTPGVSSGSGSGAGHSTSSAPSAPKSPSSQAGTKSEDHGTTTTEQNEYSDGHNDSDHDD